MQFQIPFHPVGQTWRRIIYRLRQFFLGLSAQVSDEERQLVRSLLPPAALALFAQMPVDAQRHALNVYDATRQAGVDQPELAMAALLHDVGKIAAAQAGLHFSLWLRGPLVMLEALWPAWLRRASSPTPSQGWRYLLFVHFEHPSIGAAWAEQAACPPLACWLIQHHQDSFVNAPAAEYDFLLKVLQKADASN